MTAMQVLCIAGVIEVALFALLLVCAPYMLWCDYLCVMTLKRQRDNKSGGGLSKPALTLGTFILIRGYLLDCFCNVLHMTIALRELPQELTVTKRLRRHIEGSTEHAAFCLSIRTQLLDGFDPAGIHR